MLEDGRVRPGRLRRGGGRAVAGWSPATGSSRATASSGCRRPGCARNGYTLARRVLFERAGLTLDSPAWPGAGHTLADELLRPSVIYAPALVALCREVEVRALAHITGGGLPGNIPRVLPDNVDAVIHRGTWEVPEIFYQLRELGPVSDRRDGRRVQPGHRHGGRRVARRRCRQALAVLRAAGLAPSSSARSSPAHRQVRFA